MKALCAYVGGLLPVQVLIILDSFQLLWHQSPKISYIFCLCSGKKKYKNKHKEYSDLIYDFFLVCLMLEGNEMNAENGSSVLMVWLEFVCFIK